jgi:hypothetical protein
MGEDKNLNDLIDAFEERMRKKREAEEKAEKEKAERLRQDYLRRTGRTEIKP